MLILILINLFCLLSLETVWNIFVNAALISYMSVLLSEWYVVRADCIIHRRHCSSVCARRCCWPLSLSWQCTRQWLQPHACTTSFFDWSVDILAVCIHVHVGVCYHCYWMHLMCVKLYCTKVYCHLSNTNLEVRGLGLWGEGLNVAG